MVRGDQIECSGERIGQSPIKLQEEVDGDKTSGVEPNNEYLEDFFPKSLMFLIRFFRLVDPNIRYRLII